ncbi:GTPase family protein [Rhodocyclaceae bacterium SMB388]
MKSLLRQIDPLRLLALVLLVLPGVIVFGLGIYWLWRADKVVLWLIGFAVCGALGYVLQQWLVRRDRRLLADAITDPNPDWPPSADAAWQRVDALALACEPQDWPLDHGSRVLELGRRTLDTVARTYHPEVERPLLELTVPHALLIIERASRDLRSDVTDNIPFSHRLTIGDLFRIQRWKATAETAFDVYRAGRMVVNPLDALIGEAWRHLRDRSFGLAQGEIHRWLLRAFVRKVGYYAIDLYSGRLPLSEPSVSEAPTGRSRSDRDTAAAAATRDESEPLRILVLGRANAGKSSLINALFGRLVSATDALPDTTSSIKPFALEREGLTRALVFDTPGCDTERFEPAKIDDAVRDADLILWVSAVNRPDRDVERRNLDRVRAVLAAHPHRRPPPILAAATHIDQLRPAAEWQPPYDLADPKRPKAVQMRAAVEALAADLDVPLDSIVPVCTAEARIYNVDDALWSAILSQQDAALHTRLLRCMEARRREENWQLVGRQLRATGRLLRDLPRKWRDGDER